MRKRSASGSKDDDKQSNDNIGVHRHICPSQITRKCVGPGRYWGKKEESDIFAEIVRFRRIFLEDGGEVV
jgi:hypothetical protein